MSLYLNAITSSFWTPCSLRVLRSYKSEDPNVKSCLSGGISWVKEKHYHGVMKRIKQKNEDWEKFLLNLKCCFWGENTKKYSCFLSFNQNMLEIPKWVKRLASQTIWDIVCGISENYCGYLTCYSGLIITITIMNPKGDLAAYYQAVNQNRDGLVNCYVCFLLLFFFTFIPTVELFSL